MLPHKYLFKSDSLSLQFPLMLLVVVVLLLLSSRAIHSQDLVILPTFNTNITAAQRAVIQQAISEWDAIIRSRGRIAPSILQIEFRNAVILPVGNVGRATFRSTDTRRPILVTIRFDNGSTAWYVDPTPNNPLDDNIPSNQFDYLSVARHEIGHAIGLSGQRSEPNAFFNATSTTFDQARLNIGIDTGNNSLHTLQTAHPNDIMNPSIGSGNRQLISLYPAASLIARAYQCDITMDFVDGSNNTGIQTGSATHPWNNLTTWQLVLPGRRALLLIPGTFRVPVPFIHDRPVTIDVARGRNAVIKQ